jgi:hypothetical protein
MKAIVIVCEGLRKVTESHQGERCLLCWSSEERHWFLTDLRNRRKKDPGKPKKPMSAYLCYSQKRRPEMRLEEPTLGLGQVPLSFSASVSLSPLRAPISLLCRAPHLSPLSLSTHTRTHTHTHTNTQSPSPDGQAPCSRVGENERGGEETVRGEIGRAEESICTKHGCLSRRACGCWELLKTCAQRDVQ